MLSDRARFLVRRGLQVLGVGGLLAVLFLHVAINFISFSARSKQAEAKAYLRLLATNEQAFFAEKSTYSPRLDDIGFAPERGNRYAYYLEMGSCEVRDTSIISAEQTRLATCVEVDTFKFGQSELVRPRPAPAFSPIVQPGATGFFTAVAAGNVDVDLDTDRWSVSSRDRKEGKVSDATMICASDEAKAGEPCLDHSDVKGTLWQVLTAAD